MKRILLIFGLALVPSLVLGQTATVNWTSTHQTIDGFGVADVYEAPFSSPNQSFFFGQGSGQLGLSILRVAVSNAGSSGSGNCSTVSSSCAGSAGSDIAAVLAQGGKVYASSISPPAAYTTNGSTYCSPGSGQLATASYANFATWQANFVLSLQTYDSATLYGLSVQNEPDYCPTYDGATYSGAQMDSYVKTNLGPQFVTDSLTTKIAMPETSTYANITTIGGTCAGDSSCSTLVGIANFHDYGSSLSGYTVTPATLPGGWPGGWRWWQTEASCVSGPTPSWCPTSGWLLMPAALQWAAVLDQRMQDGVNAWLWWWGVNLNADGEGLIDNANNTTKTAYVMGQYARWIRPGSTRIDATHTPQTGITVSAYQNSAAANALTIIATNQTSSPVSQTFNITNAPTFTTLTPIITSSTQSLAVQSAVSVSGNSFTYSLPADSVVTFEGTSSGGGSCTPTASSANESDVSTALTSVASCTTAVVTIPPSTGLWTSQLTYSIPAGLTNLTIQGNTTVSCTGTPGTSSYACTATDHTIFQDNNTSTNFAFLQINASGVNSTVRLTGLTFQGGTGITKGQGTVLVYGPTHNLRIDHDHFNEATYTGGSASFWMHEVGEIEGVADHNVYDNGTTGIVQANIASNNIGDTLGNGDGTWANPTPFGTAGNFFIESNIMNGGTFTDCDTAGNVVVRYNTANGTTSVSAAMHSHGTYYNSGRARSCRSYEFYKNYVTGPAGGTNALVGSEGGTSLVWGNDVVSGYQNLGNMDLARNRVTEIANPNGWGYCGTAAMGNGLGSAWDGNQNTSTGYPCLDGLGRGQGLSLNGQGFPYAGQQGCTPGLNCVPFYPLQYLEPIYYFANLFPGVSTAVVTGSDFTPNQDVYADCNALNSACTGTFNGTAGTGSGLLSARPTACTAGPGGTYGTSPTGSYGVAYWATDANGGNGELYVCTASGSPGTWTPIYQPYTYPHPLAGGTPQANAPTFSPSSGVPPISGGVTMSCSTGGSIGCYTTNGATPTATVAGTCDGSPTNTYSSAISVSVNPTTLNGICTAASFLNSSVNSATYSGSAPVCGNPFENGPNYGGPYPVPPNVLPIAISLTSPSGCPMFYTVTTDGSIPAAPTCSSTPYPGGGFSLATIADYHYRFIACQSGYTNSGVVGDEWLVTGTQTTTVQGVKISGVTF